MFEVVASEWMRNYLKDRRQFTDWEKAALIWNSPTHTWRERLDSLKELSAITEDETLKGQITERISYEDIAYQLFTDNQSNKYVYVVFDDRRCACGFFSDYEMARSYGIKYCEDYDCCRYAIEKQLLFGEATKGKVIPPWTSKHNILKGNIEDESGYNGTENACAHYDKEGNVRLFYSSEMPASDKNKVDPQDRQRFEYRFFKIPFGMKDGTIVKMVETGEYAVLDGGEECWNSYMKKTDANPLYYDYSDIQTIAYAPCDNGHWAHMHVNPMYLEPALPEVEEGDKKEEAYRTALVALSEFFKNETKENNEKAIKASRDYADACADFINWSRLVYETEDVKKLLF